MPYQSNRRRPVPGRGRKRRYRLKPVPIAIAAILVIGLIVGIVWGIGKITAMIAGDGTSSTPSSKMQASSNPPSSDSDSSDAGTSEGGSSDDGSAVSGTDSSGIDSSDADSSKANSSNTAAAANTAPSSKNDKGSSSAAPALKNYGAISNSYDSVVNVASIDNDPLWNLILLNPGHAITEEIPMKRVKVDEQYVDERAYAAYKEMYDAAKAAGHTLFLRSGYRSIKTQGVNYAAEIKRQQEKLGKSKEEATKAAELYYTRPGHSEHHAGLAFDLITPEYHKNIYTLSEKFADTEAYKWMVANCADYGFILRYPKDKKEITQINFEPWHYRYVGKDHAKIIMDNNLCLEEYIAEMEGKFAELHPDKVGTDEEHNAFAAFAIAYPANR